MFALQHPGPMTQQPARARGPARLPRRARCAATCPRCATLLRDEGALSHARRAELDALMDTLRRADPLEAEADYVELFDRGRSTSLHLFEHVHGDSRERGPAMIDLGQTYEKAGLILAEGELPDYLPAVLEFVSTQPPREARAFLGEMAHIFNAIFGALQQRDSAYASVLGALLELAGEKAQPVTAGRRSRRSTRAGPSRSVFDGCSTKGQAKPGQPQPIHVVRQRTHRHPAGSRRMNALQTYLHNFFFNVYPYICLAVFLMGSLARFDRDQYTWKSDSSQMLRTGTLRWGSNLFHVGILFLFFGHFVGLLTPHWVYEHFISAAAQAADGRATRAASPASSASSA